MCMYSAILSHVFSLDLFNETVDDWLRLYSDCEAIIFNVAHTDTQDIPRPEPEHYIGPCVATTVEAVEQLAGHCGVSKYYKCDCTNDTFDVFRAILARPNPFFDLLRTPPSESPVEKQLLQWSEMARGVQGHPPGAISSCSLKVFSDLQNSRKSAQSRCLFWSRLENLKPRSLPFSAGCVMGCPSGN